MNIDYINGPHIVLATDGACLGNPGPGGWGVVGHEYDGDNLVSRFALAGRAEGDTTNNQMELQAAFEGLRYLGGTSTPIVIVTDSQYVVNGMTQYMERWKQNGWRTANRKTVKNLAQWQALDDLTRGRKVYWEWTQGHHGHPMNEAADRLAYRAATGELQGHPEELASVYPELFSW
jgi:ribonuclease HI